MSKPSDVIPASERALQILTCIARAPQAVSVRALSAHTGLPRSTLYRHLQALKKWGWVQAHADSGLYEPGALAVQLARRFDGTSWLIRATRTERERLAIRTQESVGLLVYVQGQMLCLDMQESPHPLRCTFAKGYGARTLKGASALSLLAHVSADEAQAWCQGAADAPGADTLAQIRANGYAVSENAVDPGVWGVSAPLFGRAGRLVATLSLMAPTERARLRAAEYIAQTCAAAARLSSILQES